MSASLTTLAYQACRDLGCLRAGTVAVQSTDLLNDILASANQIIDADRIDEMMVFATPAQIFTLTTLLEQYKIGPTQIAPNFTAQRPTGIVDANVIINFSATPTVRKPLALWTVDEWAAITVRALTPAAVAPIGAIPDGLYYDNDFNETDGSATINLWPAPQYQPQQLEIFTTQTLPFNSFADLTTVYNFPPAYERYIRKAIADEIMPMMVMNWKAHRLEGLQAPSEQMWAKVHQQAIDAKAAVMSANAPDAIKNVQPMFRGAGQKGVFNYAVGTNSKRSI